MSNLAYKVQQEKQFVEQTQPSQKKLFQRRITKGEKVLWTAALIGLLAAAIYMVSTYATIYSLDQNIAQMQFEAQSQTKVNGELQQKVSELSRPERIYNIAKNKLGMTFKKDSVKVIGK